MACPTIFPLFCDPRAWACTVKLHSHLYANAKRTRKRTMWTCRRTVFAFIRLCGVCSANRQMLSIRSRYFKEKYVHNRTDVDVHSFGQPTNNQRNACSIACAANTEQATFWHSFAIASVLYALFMYKCGCALTRTCTWYYCACAGQVHSHFKFLQIITGHETCFSSWSCSRNFFSGFISIFL